MNQETRIISRMFHHRNGDKEIWFGDQPGSSAWLVSDDAWNRIVYDSGVAHYLSRSGNDARGLEVIFGKETRLRNPFVALHTFDIEIKNNVTMLKTDFQQMIQDKAKECPDYKGGAWKDGWKTFQIGCHPVHTLNHRGGQEPVCYIYSFEVWGQYNSVEENKAKIDWEAECKSLQVKVSIYEDILGKIVNQSAIVQDALNRGKAIK